MLVLWVFGKGLELDELEILGVPGQFSLVLS